MEPADTDAVQQLWSVRFGGAPSTQSRWIEAALDPTHSAVGFVAEPDRPDRIAGFSLLDVAGRDYTHQYLGLDVIDAAPPLADRNGIFHLSCVRVDWEGRGIGSAFYDRRLSVLTDRSVPRTFGIAWHRPHTVDSRALFENRAFTTVATVERYYARTGSRPNCPDCGGPCTCTATIYARTVGPAKGG